MFGQIRLFGTVMLLLQFSFVAWAQDENINFQSVSSPSVGEPATASPNEIIYSQKFVLSHHGAKIDQGIEITTRKGTFSLPVEETYFYALRVNQPTWCIYKHKPTKSKRKTANRAFRKGLHCLLDPQSTGHFSQYAFLGKSEVIEEKQVQDIVPTAYRLSKYQLTEFNPPEHGTWLVVNEIAGSMTLSTGLGAGPVYVENYARYMAFRLSESGDLQFIVRGNAVVHSGKRRDYPVEERRKKETQIDVPISSLPVRVHSAGAIILIESFINNRITYKVLRPFDNYMNVVESVVKDRKVTKIKQTIPPRQISRD